VRRRERVSRAFEDWRETIWAEEDEARHKLDRKIKHEAKWAVEGISARRKRNMGRVRALQDLRAERARDPPPGHRSDSRSTRAPHRARR
jgi:ATP-binding cassette subfamily F protein uup